MFLVAVAEAILRAFDAYSWLTRVVRLCCRLVVKAYFFYPSSRVKVKDRLKNYVNASAITSLSENLRAHITMQT